MSSKIVLRDAVVDMVVDGVKDVVRSAVVQTTFPGGIHRTCMTCVAFNRQQELCNKHREWGRPPAHIIAYGCDEYFDDETIPF